MLVLDVVVVVAVEDVVAKSGRPNCWADDVLTMATSHAKVAGFTILVVV